MVFYGRGRIKTEQNKDILQNKSLCKCTSSLREVINAIYSVEEYANIAPFSNTAITDLHHDTTFFSSGHT